MSRLTARAPRPRARGLLARALLWLWTLGPLACHPGDGADAGPTAPQIVSPRAPAPRLVVLVVVDQMRADALTRFAADWPSKQGFRRITHDGLRFEQAFVSHALTFTAPGHASLVTGVHPSRHGVALNHWFARARGHEVHAGEDPESTRVGPEVDGTGVGHSPLHLRRDAVGDWLKRASPRSKVYAVAVKPRASVMLGGHRPDGAFWYDPAGVFVTSSYYASFPEALGPYFYEECGDLTAPLREGEEGAWTRLLAPAVYERLAGPDAAAGEAFGTGRVFPHRLFRAGRLRPRELARYHERFASLPFADGVTIELVTHLLTWAELGTDDAPDLLLIGFSAGDAIGHAFGPDSHEKADYYLRLDGYLAALLQRLDQRVGAGAYGLVLTSDHGVMATPEVLQTRGVSAEREARRVDPVQHTADVTTIVRDVLQREFRLPVSTLLHVRRGGVWLDRARARQAGVEPGALQRAVARALARLPYVVDTFTAAELTDPRVADDARPWLLQYRRSFVPDRSPDIEMRFGTWSPVGGEPHGATHGSPYAHDTHVPLIIVAPDLAPGVRAERVRLVDVAPTLAQLLGIETPRDLDGRSLLASR